MKPYRDGSRGIWIRVLTFAAVVIAVVCCFTLFFQVAEIRTVGNSVYSDEQIIDASGISIGDSMILIRKANAASLIRNSLPFVESVHIARVLPNAVEITVTESDAVFVLHGAHGEYYSVSSGGVVLGQPDAVGAEDYPNVEGVSVSSAAVGEEIRCTDSAQEAWNAAKELMQSLSEYGLASSVTVIDVSKLFDIRVRFGSRFEVLFGGTARLPYKTEYLAAVFRELGGEASGVIDLSFEEEDQARFQPY